MPHLFNYRVAPPGDNVIKLEEIRCSLIQRGSLIEEEMPPKDILNILIFYTRKTPKNSLKHCSLRERLFE